MQRIKLLALDLDGTLAAVNQAISCQVKQLLQQITDQGVRLAILSGKPTAYLSGLTRQLGIEDIILSGENGAEVQFGYQYPPPQFYSLSKNRKFHDEQLVSYLLNRYANRLWIQPNTVNFSIFAEPIILKEIHAIFTDYLTQRDDLLLYSHVDCIELVDKNISKGKALHFISQQLNLTHSQVCAIGDGSNDIDMLQMANYRYAINHQLPVENLQVFTTIELALYHLIENLC